MDAQIKVFADSLKELATKVDSIVESYENIISMSETQTQPKREYLTFSEACVYLGLSKAALYNMTSRRQIPHYKPNGKSLYFKESELIAWIENKRIKTASEIEAEAAKLCVR